MRWFLKHSWRNSPMGMYWKVRERVQRKVGEHFYQHGKTRPASVMAKRKDVGIINTQEYKPQN